MSNDGDVRPTTDRNGTTRVALVTGAAGLLGSVVARLFASDNLRLGLVGRTRSRLDDLVAALDLPEDRVVVAPADLRDPDAAGGAVDAVRARFGRLDVVAHLVGGWTGGTPVAELEHDDVAAMLGQHLWTTLHVARRALPGMVDAGWGRLVAVSSTVASAPSARSGAYAVGKAAQETLFATLAREVAGTGVTANLVVVRTIRPAGARPEPGRKDPGTSAEDVAAAIRWLCSDAAAPVNGARIPLHGGG